MEDKKTGSSIPTDPAEAKRARIEQKSERIRQKGEAIARKNGTYVSFSARKQENTHAKKSDPKPTTEIVDDLPDNVEYVAKYKESTFGAAAILSAISVILLIALAAALLVGIVPISNKGDDANSIQISGSNSQSNYTDDSTMIADFLNSVVIVSVERSNSSGTGTGIILTENGYIVTNYHVVEDATSIFVKLYGSEQYVKAKLISYKAHDDIAVLKIEKKGLRPAAFVNDCNNCKVGERVYAIGAPEGTDYSWTVTQGIISSVNRELKIYASDGTMEKKLRTIQTDASVNPGNSGGPLINSKGEVVGIVTMKLQESAGMGFALPSDGVLPIVKAIIEKGNADDVTSTISSGRPLMGITCVSVQKGTWYKHTEEGIEVVTESFAKQYPKISFYAEEDGVYVKGTSLGMDAHGKFQAGDIITEINGIRIYTQYQLMSVLNDHRGGDTVSLTYYRDGKYQTVNVKLKEAPIP